MLTLKAITKEYQMSDMTVHALRGIDIEFRKKEFVAVLGPSGCGKTTLLNIIGGLDRYTTGDLLINGKSTKQFTARDWDTYRSRRIGFVFQTYNLIPHLSVLANVELALTISGISKKEKRERATAALERVGLIEQIKKKPGQLSGGQMQRVAIARAIVNNPSIILADEPTGALDSVTSVQVLDILKELSRECLVVMVTHNAELANRYSTRIVNLLDGEITGDSDPFDGELEFAADKGFDNISDISTKQEVNGDETADKPPVSSKKPKKKRSSMSLWTAVTLSGGNLLTKKFRTILTTIAGSVGIIGIALVLSISNGFSIFMKNLERTTLSSFPITVDSISFDLSEEFSSPFGTMLEGTYPAEAELTPSVPDNDYGFVSFHPNYITEAYVEYVKDMERTHPEWFATISYMRNIKMNLLTKTGTADNPKYSLVDNTTTLTSGWWQELLSEDFVRGEYDLLAGKFPTNANELVLIVDNSNQVPLATLNTLGISTPKDAEQNYLPISFSDIVGDGATAGKTFKLLYNDEFYKKTGATVVDDDDGASVELFRTLNQNEYAAAYEASQTELEIVGIIRIKRDADLYLLSPGIGYLPSLTEAVIQNSLNSQIVAAQKNTFIDVLGNGSKKFEYDFSAVDLYVAQLKLDISGLPDLYLSLHMLDAAGYNRLKGNPNFKFKDLYDEIAAYDQTLSDPVLPIDKMLLPLLGLGINTDVLKNFLNADYIDRLKEIGADSIPVSIYIYPSSFAYKSQICAHLDAYNTLIENETDHIEYNDIASSVSKSVSQMVDITSYVLIAFAAISLLVSSIMIGIITYISVLERTKEIGVLRSLGARKLDISNLFNAETAIIGLASGILGVVIATVLTIPINSIITYYAGPLVKNLAQLNAWHGVLLVALSVVLTLISGLIPATIAAKKDPVVALRE